MTCRLARQKVKTHLLIWWSLLPLNVWDSCIVPITISTRYLRLLVGTSVCKVCCVVCVLCMWLCAARSATMSGGMYIISRSWFNDLGGYDVGMDTWGAENLEMSFRVSTLLICVSKYSLGLLCLCTFSFLCENMMSTKIDILATSISFACGFPVARDWATLLNHFSIILDPPVWWWCLMCRYGCVVGPLKWYPALMSATCSVVVQRTACPAVATPARTTCELPKSGWTATKTISTTKSVTRITERQLYVFFFLSFVSFCLSWLTGVAGWCHGLGIRLTIECCRLNSRPFHFHVTTLAKMFHVWTSELWWLSGG